MHLVILHCHQEGVVEVATLDYLDYLVYLVYRELGKAEFAPRCPRFGCSGVWDNPRLAPE
jgi:hypothetical protein